MGLLKSYNVLMNSDFGEYRGKWIALIDEQIVASGTSIKNVFEKAKEKFPNARPFFFHVPDLDIISV